MIVYHGTPITPQEAAARILAGRHGLVSFATPIEIELVAEVCDSFVLDNGAWDAYRRGVPITDWQPYYDWCAEWLRHPACDWALIPDAIGGDEEANRALVAAWPHDPARGVPVWHLHESFDYLACLACGSNRIAFGSSGDYEQIGTPRWHARMAEALDLLADSRGALPCKVHGLRMADVKLTAQYPFSSVDSSNVARNIGLDCRWTGTNPPPTKAARGIVLAEKMEHGERCRKWVRGARQLDWTELLEHA